MTPDPTTTASPATTAAPPVADHDNPELVAQVADWLRLLVEPGSVVELRVPKYQGPRYQKPVTRAGFYDANHLKQMAWEALFLSQFAPGVYWTINALNPSMLKRNANQTTDVIRKKVTAESKDVLYRRWLMVDIDPVRAHKDGGQASATDAEKAAAFALAMKIRDWLRSFGFPDPVVIDSGNGYYLLYRIDLPADDNGLVQRVLAAVAEQFKDVKTAAVDKKVFDPPRIMKVPGTWARKGEDTPERPHRRCEVLEIPADIKVVPAEALEKVAALAPPLEASSPKSPQANSSSAVNRPYIPAGPHESSNIRRMAAALKKKPGAVQGQNGSDATFCAVAYSLRDFHVSVEAGWPYLWAWNLTCTPPWTEPEFRRKISEVLAKGRHEFGHALGNGSARMSEIDGVPEVDLDGVKSQTNGHTGGPPLAPHEVAAVEQPRPRPTEFSNYHEEDQDRGENTVTVRVAHAIQTIRQNLDALTGGWPKRCGKALFVNANDQVDWLDAPNALFGWVAEQLPQRGESRLSWDDRGTGMIGRGVFFSNLQQTAEQWEAVESFPHEPPLPRHYYIHPPLAGGDGSALREFLSRFSPATDVDAQLLKAMLLTIFWGGGFGQRPAFLVQSEGDDGEAGRGVGKTKLVQAFAELRGGVVLASAEEDMQAIKTRLLSEEAKNLSLALLDNVKTLRFSWADLESLITAKVISGHRMYRGEGRRPNNLVWFVTMNGGALSKDLAQRCVPILMKRPNYTSEWEASLNQLIESRRWEIIGDVVAELRREPPKMEAKETRWAAWERAVLSKVANPDEAMKVIEERRGAVDDDKAEAELIRDEIVAELRRRGHDPETEAVWFPAKIGAKILFRVTNDKRATNKASSYLAGLRIKGLRKSDRTDLGGKGWEWVGAGFSGDPDEKAVVIKASLSDELDLLG